MTDDDDQTAKRCVGLTLRELREERGLSQEDHAQQADLSTDYLAEVENGDRDPSWVTIVGILSVLDQPVDEFGAVYARVKRNLD